MGSTSTQWKPKGQSRVPPRFRPCGAGNCDRCAGPSAILPLNHWAPRRGQRGGEGRRSRQALICIHCSCPEAVPAKAAGILCPRTNSLEKHPWRTKGSSTCRLAAQRGARGARPGFSAHPSPNDEPSALSSGGGATCSSCSWGQLGWPLRRNQTTPSTAS